MQPSLVEKTNDKKTAVIQELLAISTIGQGSFSQVTLTKTSESEKLWAIKSFSKDEHVISKNKQVFLNELVALKALKSCPFIVQLYSAFQTPKSLHLALEFCCGGEVLGLLQKKGKIEESLLKFYAAQVLLALQSIHENGFIYRDLKPENVLIFEDGYIKLADFGFAEPLDRPGPRKVCGTREYFSPEMVFGDRVGIPADWWAFGCFLFEMAAGYPAFERDESDPDKIFEHILLTKPKFPDHISKNLRNLIEGLLCKNPKKRLGSKGPQPIKLHPWFEDIDFALLSQKKVEAPFLPQTKDLGLQNFDEEYRLIKPEFDHCLLWEENFDLSEVSEDFKGKKEEVSLGTTCSSDDNSLIM